MARQVCHAVLLSHVRFERTLASDPARGYGPAPRSAAGATRTLVRFTVPITLAVLAAVVLRDLQSPVRVRVVRRCVHRRRDLVCHQCTNLVAYHARRARATVRDGAASVLRSDERVQPGHWPERAGCNSLSDRLAGHSGRA